MTWTDADGDGLIDDGELKVEALAVDHLARTRWPERRSRVFIVPGSPATGSAAMSPSESAPRAATDSRSTRPAPDR